jgi:hypothetical protein
MLLAASAEGQGMTEDDARRFLVVFEELIALNDRKATEALFIEAVKIMRLEAFVYIKTPLRRMQTSC